MPNVGFYKERAEYRSKVIKKRSIRPLRWIIVSQREVIHKLYNSYAQGMWTKLKMASIVIGIIVFILQYVTFVKVVKALVV